MIPRRRREDENRGTVTQGSGHQKEPGSPVPANILNFAVYKILHVDETECDYHIRSQVAHPFVFRPSCGSDRLYRHGRNERVIRDLPIHGKRVGIYVSTQPGRGPRAGRSLCERLTVSRAVRTLWIGRGGIRQNGLKPGVRGTKRP